MSDKSIYSNPYFYMFLMDDKNEYFKSVEDYWYDKGVCKYELEKIVKKEGKLIGNKNMLGKYFGDFNVVGKNELVDYLLSIDPDGDPYALSLRKIFVSIEVSQEQKDETFYPWTISLRVGERVFRISAYIHVDINMKFRYRNVFVTANCYYMGMVARVVFTSLVQKIIQNTFQDEKNMLVYLNMLEGSFENHFTSLEEKEIKSIPPLILYNIVASQGYDGYEFITSLYVSNPKTGEGGFRLTNKTRKIFKYSIWFKSVFSISEETFNYSALVYSPVEIVVSNGSEVVLNVAPWFKEKIKTTFFAFGVREVKSYDFIEKYIYSTMELDNENHPLSLLVRKEAFQKMMDFFNGILG